MTFKIDYEPCSQRWSVSLPDEPGKPRIEADTPELLEQFLCDVEAGIFQRTKEDASVPFSARR